MALDFVKFQKGTQADYDILKARGRIEKNTLYFLYTEGEPSGVLYCGSVLIGSVGSGASINSISSLKDVLIENAGATDILLYTSDGKWKNASINEIANLVALQDGLGFTVNEQTFSLEPVGEVPLLELKGFKNAMAGAMPFKSVDGSISWSAHNVDTLAGEVGDLQLSFIQLQNNVNNQIATMNRLNYTVVSDQADATESNTIYLIPNNNDTGINKYNEFMVIDGTLEDLGPIGIDLNGYVTTEGLQAVVGDFSDLTTYDAGSPTTIVNEINNIYQRLTWGKITN